MLLGGAGPTMGLGPLLLVTLPAVVEATDCFDVVLFLWGGGGKTYIADIMQYNVQHD